MKKKGGKKQQPAAPETASEAAESAAPAAPVEAGDTPAAEAVGAAPAPVEAEPAAGHSQPPPEEDAGVATARTGEDERLRQMMASNFIEYASYVIRDRAIPDINDGLKPVQRRILYALSRIDDGRFHKVANVVGQTMQYHPHGDASIYSALVVLANKEYFIDKQGNFGNIFTGDEASAARYIECRLTPLAKEVLFNSEITEFVDSYDGRNREPVSLPAKVPAMLMLGADGIAVGMTTRILPHNFDELLKAQVAVLRGRSFHLYPDFLTGGIMDARDYDDGRGRIKVRARIEEKNDKTLVIRDIPPTTTTDSLMGSIEDAARRGKVKIAGITDYTAEQVEIEIALPRGIHAAETIRQLYAYTECETAITSNLTLIKDGRPAQMTVSEVLRYNTQKLLEYLRRELEIALGKLDDKFHEKTLEQIFIENRIYKRIEECETAEKITAEIRKGLDKFRSLLKREITDEDIERLLQIRIRRISLFDINKNRQDLDAILEEIKKVKHNLANLVDYAVDYIQDLRKRYSKLFPRRTEISELEVVNVKEVALQNVKVGLDRQGNYVGREVRNSNKNEDPLVCTEFDRLVLLRNDGAYKVIPIPDKLYVGPVRNLLKSDKDQVYSMLYRDRKTKALFAKRFRIDRFIMDKDYQSLPKGCIIEALYTNYGVVVRCEFKPKPRLREKEVVVDFEQIPLRAAGARGFKITPHEVANFVQLKRGSAEPSGAGEDEAKAATPGAGDAPATPKVVHPDDDNPDLNLPPEPEPAAAEDVAPATTVQATMEPATAQPEAEAAAAKPGKTRRGKAAKAAEPAPVKETEQEPATRPSQAAAPEPVAGAGGSKKKGRKQAAAKPLVQEPPEPTPDPDPEPEPPQPAPAAVPSAPEAKPGKTARKTLAKKEVTAKPPVPEPPAEKSMADEWTERSRKGARLPAAQDEAKETPEPQPAEAKKRGGRKAAAAKSVPASAPAAAPAPEAKAVPPSPPAKPAKTTAPPAKPPVTTPPPRGPLPTARKLIDEDSPFFLE